MRIVGGTFRGRRLQGPKSKEIRPALDKVKQAIFNILGPVEGFRVLDLFAGTGSIGIEALSRGAASALFADSGSEAIPVIKKNLSLCGLQRQSAVFPLSIPQGLRRLKKRGPFDLIFVDPPYDRDLVNPTLQAIAREKILSPSGTVVVEHSPREPIASEYKPERIHSGRLDGASGQAASDQMGFQGRAVSPLTIYDQRKYGQTLVSFLGFPSSLRYVNSIREKSSSLSDEKFLAELRKWHRD